MSARRRTKMTKERAILAVVIALILLAALAVLYFMGLLGPVLDILLGTETEPDTPREPTVVSGEMVIHFIDVGQADCILLQSEDKVMLVDTGDLDDDYTNKIINYLKGQGVSTIDYLILTHPDADHIGGAPEIINEFKVTKCIMPDFAKSTKIFTNTLNALEQNNVEVIPMLSVDELPLDPATPVMKPGDTFTVGQAQCKLLAPIRAYDDANEVSVVIRVDFGEKSVLLTGDAEKESEADMAKRYSAADLKVDVLKSGHHGSSTSSSPALLDKAQPTYAVISCGTGNSYGHPHDETIARYNEYGIKYYRTDLNGTVIFRTDGTDYTLTPEKN